MRLLVIVLTFLLFVGILGFVLTNLDAKVPVTVWKTALPDLPVYLVALLSVAVGALYAGIIGVAEGAHIRFANRRLRKQIQKLEAELNYARTQTPSAPRPEPDAVDEGGTVLSSIGGARSEDEPPSAPVYGPEEDWTGDPDDDTYSGGRAV